MLKRPHFIALGLVGILALVILNLPQHTATQLKLALGGLFLPLFGLSRSSEQLARKGGDAVTSKADLLREVETLRRTNEVLQLVAAQNDALLKENNTFRQLLGWQQQQVSWKNRLRLGRVIARDPANWWQIVHIDLGSRDGLLPDLPVMSPDGFLVGRVASVSLTRSEVLLISNPTCRISAEVEKANEKGIITGAAGPLDTTLVTLGMLPPSSGVKPGETVTTSGLAILPKGIRIGQIAENPQASELGSGEVRVKLFANPATLDEVWVLLP